MILLFDIGNTNTHVGLADNRRVVRHTDIPTAAWFSGKAAAQLARFVGKAQLEGAAICSVVPRATPQVRKAVRTGWNLPALELTPRTLNGVGIDYPRPETIGPDRSSLPTAPVAPLVSPRAPESSDSPEPSDSPVPSESPESEVSNQPSDLTDPADTPEPTATVRPARTREPAETPRPTRTPRLIHRCSMSRM